MERIKAIEDQGVIINRQFLQRRSLHEPTDNNSNTINTTPTVSFPNNTPVSQNYGAYIFLLSEGIGSLEPSLDMQHQNLTQMSPVKSNIKETNVNKESDV